MPMMPISGDEAEAEEVATDAEAAGTEVETAVLIVACPSFVLK
jgi:hypothetical protein